ncbi:MAG: ABC transporter permease subunit [Nitrospira sp.]|nr:ABC transporter permease subunit [Candidatus Manganitrophaceae bacterium]HIL34422.1 ABC transporter permease subunit [Candidatus Manganitrophaceae bacterium]
MKKQLKKEIIRKTAFGMGILILSGLLYALSQQIAFPENEVTLDTTISQLPYYASYSLLRMSVAYLISFVFSIIYGYIAATVQKAEGPMIAVLDLLQSIPILGFFPVAVLFFINLFQGSRWGIEAASIFLIFTSMSWNMAFSVYESLKTLPKDLAEASDAFCVRGWLRFRKNIFPICIPKLVYSSMLSWSGGWYFLIAAEIIAIGPVKHRLPGLGSFLIQSTETGQLIRTCSGLAVLILIIVFFHLFIWKPLSVWSEKFRYESSSSTTPSASFVLQWYRKLLSLKLFSSTRIAQQPHPLPGHPKPSPQHKKPPISTTGGKIGLIALKGIGILAVGLISYGVGKSVLLLIEGLTPPFPPEVGMIPMAILASFLRLTIAYIIALAWTLPAAIWVGENPRAFRIFTPLAEIGAAIPAPALFPFFIFFAINTFGGMNGAAILLILTGMQWYLFFNLIGGVRSIPGDLKEAARSFGLTKWQYWKRLYLPAVFPSLITGSITAWGGGWNALIVSEYIVYQQKTYSVIGIGAMLDRAIYEAGDTRMILFTLLAMIITIALLNRLFWRRLYLYAITRYKFEY